MAGTPLKRVKRIQAARELAGIDPPGPGILRLTGSTGLAGLEQEQRDSILGDALNRFAAGETLGEIGNSLGVSRQTLTNWLIREHPEQYSAAQKTLASLFATEMRTRLEEIDIHSANAHLAIARAREQNNTDKFILERRFPKQFGQHNQIDITHKIDIAERLERARERLTIEVVATKDE